MLCIKLDREKMIFKVVNIFSLLSPLEKGRGPSFEQIWFPITQGCFVPSLVEIGPVVLKEKIFKVGQRFSLFSYFSPWKWAGSLI